MSEFKICVPSKGRGGICKTMDVFKTATLFVPEQELPQYSMYMNVIGVPKEVKGITATRNWILKNTKENVFFIDDDFQYGGFFIRYDESYSCVRIKDEAIYIREIEKLFEVTKQIGGKINGLFTVGNNLTNYPWNPFLLNGVCLGSCMGVINDGTYYFDEEFEVKEDYELTLRCLKDGIPTVRSNIIFMQHEHTESVGGCRDSKRIDKEKKALLMLNEKYPGWIKEAKHRGASFSLQLNY